MSGDNHKAESKPDENAPTAAPVVVGIGASAGGLETFKGFFQNLPADCGMAFVLVQHLDPGYGSMLVELLQRETSMAVTEAETGALVQPNHVFVTPPNASLTIGNGRLDLEIPAPPRIKRRPIDTFLASLAEDQGENAVAIVLSGTGSDGTLGVRKIKAHGGYVLAQAEFDKHAQEGMPRSAATAGLVDEILQVEAMPANLASYRKNLNATAAHKDRDGTRTDAREHLDTICILLQEYIGHDFSQYKDKTLTRRIQRRMQVLQIESMVAYTERLRAEPDEREHLFHELLIGVTQFFRDPGAWVALGQHVIPQLFEDKVASDTIRVWVPGCGTGEEAYTLAILLQEGRECRDVRPHIQLFGTDIDAGAVDLAQTARYKALPGVDDEDVQRWFIKDSGAYFPARTLREMCVFSPHDVVKDPPFPRLDLICCRNLLIYMKPELQDCVLRKFHYGLKNDGWLFLGGSEGVSRNTKLFGAFDKKHRLYQRRDAPDQAPHDFSLPSAPFAGETRAASHAMPRADDNRIDRNARRMMQKYSPAWVVIDRDHEILRFSGGEMGRYLEPSAGAASFNLTGIVNRVLRPAVRAAVQKAFSSGSAVIDEKLTLRVDGRPRAITLITEPLETGDALCVVAFADTGPAETGNNAEQDTRPGVTELEQALHATRGQLHATINELEPTNEEMKSAYEELQSSNEELETLKEEMLSVNEELRTVNAELMTRNNQLSRANSELKNLFDSTEIATLFLDNGLRVKRFTPPTRDLFHLRESDLGRPVTDIATRLDYAGLERDVKQVLRNLGKVQREVRIEADDATYIMRIRPYCTVGNVIEGVVITFTNISDRTRAEAEQARLAAIVASSDDAIVGKDLDGIIQSWNPAAEKLFGYSAAEAIGQSIEIVIPPDRPDEEPSILRKIRRGERIEHYEAPRLRKDGRSLDVSLTISPIKNRKGIIVGASKIARDISERLEAERHRDMLLDEINHRAKNTLANVQSIAEQTLDSSPSPGTFKDAFVSRLRALSLTHDLLTQGNWRGADLEELVTRTLLPYQREDRSPWRAEGEKVQLNAKAVLAFGMILHELATNAAKYGALSTNAGNVEVTWQTQPDGDANADDRLCISWVETGGPAVEAPARRGFGSRLIEDGLKHELEADVTLAYKPAGVRCTIDVALDIVTRAVDGHTADYTHDYTRTPAS